ILTRRNLTCVILTCRNLTCRNLAGAILASRNLAGSILAGQGFLGWVLGVSSVVRGGLVGWECFVLRAVRCPVVPIGLAVPWHQGIGRLWWGGVGFGVDGGALAVALLAPLVGRRPGVRC
ncbi:hypothetical protein, partial [Nonomuraea sp. NPDC002799]